MDSKPEILARPSLIVNDFKRRSKQTNGVKEISISQYYNLYKTPIEQRYQQKQHIFHYADNNTNERQGIL